MLHQMNKIHDIQSYKFNVHFNIILPSTPSYSMLSLSFRLYSQNSLFFRLLKQFSLFQENRNITAVLTKDIHVSSCCTRKTKSTIFHPITLVCILLLFSHPRPGIRCYRFPLGFPTKILYSFILSSVFVK